MKITVTTGDKIRHYFNPTHVFCRLMDCRISKNKSKKIMKWYQLNIYNRLNKDN